MIQELDGRTYDNHFVPKEPAPTSYVLHYRANEALVNATETTIDVPRLADFPTPPNKLTFLFSIDEDDFFLARDEDVAAPQGFSYAAVSWLRNAAPAYLLFAVATGWQLHNWYRDNRFCGTCGHPTQLVPTSREVCCPNCARVIYPKISPGVIVGIVDREAERICLTKYAGRPHTQYALVAGFTEIGEPIEDTVRREVMEEVGLRVRNLRFVGSQPWSFSDSLLVGFWCEVDGSRELVVDHVELKEAAWVSPADMPDRSHDHVSLTGWMMERFKREGVRVLEG